ncbi:hypothetical protein [Amycolatopsis nalaikhensis]|uniref:Uncharacterized protein n=1 Tax=Amycolatopsis nalaikhensis TaxID=715472 RepID=A0ABY8XBH1_9PSEU|nr:hypothetical protein [Amycolatopsis sp. 2-2]WIV52896.1 hypothetical protein QP939_28545 [Amycolatopsis sp. 2-2]
MATTATLQPPSTWAVSALLTLMASLRRNHDAAVIDHDAGVVDGGTQRLTHGNPAHVAVQAACVCSQLGDALTVALRDAQTTRELDLS